MATALSFASMLVRRHDHQPTITTTTMIATTASTAITLLVPRRARGALVFPRAKGEPAPRIEIAPSGEVALQMRPNLARRALLAP